MTSYRQSRSRKAQTIVIDHTRRFACLVVGGHAIKVVRIKR